MSCPRLLALTIALACAASLGYSQSMKLPVEVRPRPPGGGVAPTPDPPGEMGGTWDPYDPPPMRRPPPWVPLPPIKQQRPGWVVNPMPLIDWRSGSVQPFIVRPNPIFPGGDGDFCVQPSQLQVPVASAPRQMLGVGASSTGSSLRRGQALPTAASLVPEVYILEPDGVLFIETTTGSLLRTVGVVQPVRAALTPDKATLVVVAGFANSETAPPVLVFLSTANRAETGRLELPSAFEPFGVAITPNGDSAYLSGRLRTLTGTSAAHVLVVDLGTQQVSHEIPLVSPGGGTGADIAITPDGQRALVAGTLAYRVIDIDTNTLATPGREAGLSGARRVLIHPNANEAYYAPVRFPEDSSKLGIGIVNIATMTLVQRIEIPRPANPVQDFDMVLSPDGRTLIYADSGPGTVYLIDTLKRRIAETFQQRENSVLRVASP